MRKLLFVLALMPGLGVAQADTAMIAARDSCLQGPQDCTGNLTAPCVDAADRDTTNFMAEYAVWGAGTMRHIMGAICK